MRQQEAEALNPLTGMSDRNPKLADAFEDDAGAAHMLSEVVVPKYTESLALIVFGVISKYYTVTDGWNECAGGLTSEVLQRP